MTIKYSFEDLEVWKKAVDFSKRVIDLAEQITADRKHYRLIEQLESSASSIALNIAEGKGRYSKKEFIQYLYIARGSLFELVTLLVIFNKKGWISDLQLTEFKESGNEIGKMLSSLIKSIKSSVM